MEQLRARARGSSKAKELLDQAEMLEDNVALMSPAAYDSLSSKRMHYQSYGSRRRRKPS